MILLPWLTSLFALAADVEEDPVPISWPLFGWPDGARLERILRYQPDREPYLIFRETSGPLDLPCTPSLVRTGDAHSTDHSWIPSGPVTRSTTAARVLWFLRRHLQVLCPIDPWKEWEQRAEENPDRISIPQISLPLGLPTVWDAEAWDRAGRRWLGTGSGKKAVDRMSAVSVSGDIGLFSWKEEEPGWHTEPDGSRWPWERAWTANAHRFRYQISAAHGKALVEETTPWADRVPARRIFPLNDWPLAVARDLGLLVVETDEQTRTRLDALAATGAPSAMDSEEKTLVHVMGQRKESLACLPGPEVIRMIQIRRSRKRQG